MKDKESKAGMCQLLPGIHKTDGFFIAAFVRERITWGLDIKSMTLEELKTEMERMGEKSFRAAQLYDWMHCGSWPPVMMI